MMSFMERYLFNVWTYLLVSKRQKKRKNENEKSLKIILESQKQTRDCMEKIASRFTKNSVLAEIQSLYKKLDCLGTSLFTFEEKSLNI